MIEFRRKRDTLDRTEVLRQWVEREAQKAQYPDADQTGWGEDRLVDELETTYEEPVRYATFCEPAWTSIVVSGTAIGKFDPYPSIGCNAFTGYGRLSGAIDRLQTADIEADYPDAIDKITRFRRLYPDRDVGAVVVRQYEEFWPPVTLDGNHRAWAAVWAARSGTDVELTVHLGHETPLEALPLESSEDAQ